jgi:uncharacterized RDD family membrane protein YckC
MDDGQDRALQSGYLSEQSKRTFTIVAGVLGAAFFFIQLVGPMVAMFATMPAMVLRAFTRFKVDGSALYRGRIHLVETTTPIGVGNPGQPATSRLVRLDGDHVEDVVPLEGWEPWLLADGDRLWLISSDRMARLAGEQLEILQTPEPLGDITRPFLFQGSPAVVESRPEGERLLAWRGGAWEEVRRLSGEGRICCHQALPTDTGVLFLRRERQTLYALDTGEGEPTWRVVLSDPWAWYAFNKDGRPAVASVGSASAFRLVERDASRWVLAASFPLTRVSPDGLAVFQERPGSPLTIVSSFLPGSLDVHTWDGERLVEQRRVRGFSPLPRGMMSLMMLPHLASMLLSVLLAVILAGLMRRHRVSAYRHEGTEVAYASLTRRALSQVVDAALAGLPAAAGTWWLFADLERMFEDGLAAPWRILAVMGASVAWMGVVLVAFSVSEGLRGVTPGKALTGIRVVGTELAPCGFGRALIRNLLKLVDGFFNFLVGILMVAYTPEWQRLGDLAARTIVIRTPGPGGLRSILPPARPE